MVFIKNYKMYSIWVLNIGLFVHIKWPWITSIWIFNAIRVHVLSNQSERWQKKNTTIWYASKLKFFSLSNWIIIIQYLNYWLNNNHKWKIIRMHTWTETGGKESGQGCWCGGWRSCHTGRPGSWPSGPLHLWPAYPLNDGWPSVSCSPKEFLQKMASIRKFHALYFL